MRGDLERVARALREEAGHLTREQLDARLPGKWSAAEILEHLARTYTATAKGLQRALDAGAPAPGARTLRMRVATFLILTCGRIPTGRQAPKMALPKGAAPETALALALDGLETLDASLARAAERFGETAPVLAHPFLGLLTAREWGRFHWVHTRHHLRQIAQRVGPWRPD